MATIDTNTGLPPLPSGMVEAGPPAAGSHPGVASWILHDWPYLLLLILAIAGITWTSLSAVPSPRYWIVFTPVAALVCIAGGWRRYRARGELTHLIVGQLLQWAAIWVAMYLILMRDVRDLLNDDGVGLTLLTVIALGVFISGVHGRIWQLIVLGVFLAAAVPVIAWVEQGALFLLVAGLVLIGLAFVHWRFRHRRNAAPA